MPTIKPKQIKKREELICLNEEQVETNIKNIASFLRGYDGKQLKQPKRVFSGVIKPSEKESVQYKLANVKERAEKYELYESENQFYFIVIYSHKFEVQHFIACDWFNHLMKPFVRDERERPYVYLCFAHLIKPKQYDSIPLGLLDCPYRLVSLTQMHPITGSSSLSYASEYELLETKEKAFNDREYATILDSDPAVKLVNALPGELVRAKLIYNDKGDIYTTYKIRRVVATRSTLGYFDGSGLDMKHHAINQKHDDVDIEKSVDEASIDNYIPVEEEEEEELDEGEEVSE